VKTWYGAGTNRHRFPMSIQLVLILLALSGLAGIALGYVLRLLIALGQRGSLEIEVKQRLLKHASALTAS
jgi:hypothetical protein